MQAASDHNGPSGAPKAIEPPLPTPESFPFPYPNPYDIQLELMRTVYQAIEQRKIAIVRRVSDLRKSGISYAGRITHWNRQVVDSPDVHFNLVARPSAAAGRAG